MVSDYHINIFYISIFYSDEDGAYIADIPDLEACSAWTRRRSRR
jgi:predicted RNase H-like HicB family nuclease